MQLFHLVISSFTLGYPLKCWSQDVFNVFLNRVFHCHNRNLWSLMMFEKCCLQFIALNLDNAQNILLIISVGTGKDHVNRASLFIVKLIKGNSILKDRKKMYAIVYRYKYFLLRKFPLNRLDVLGLSSLSSILMHMCFLLQVSSVRE